MDTAGFLALLQVSDSFFPSGAFTHSLGLEQLFREGTVRTTDDVTRFASSTLERSLASSDAVSAAEAVRLAEARDLPAIIALDHQLLSMKPALELRNASTTVGRRLLAETAPYAGSPFVAQVAASVESGATPGTHAVSLGVIASAFGATPELAAALVMQGAANTVLQAAMRLSPVSHREIQEALHSLRPLVANLARDAAQPGRALQSFQPVQDIAAMRHETAAVRMFAS